jgi:hypothetical protein
MTTTTISEKEALLMQLDESFVALKEFMSTAAANHTEIHKVEDEIFRRLLKIGLLTLKSFLQASGTGYQPQAPPREKGNALPYKGTAARDYFSIFGELPIKRARYLKSSGEYYYPLDQQLNLPGNKYSYLLQQWLQARAVETDYREAVKWLNETFGFAIHPSVPQRLGHTLGDAAEKFDANLAPPAPETEGPCLAISADGKGVRILKSERATEDAISARKPRRGKGEKPGIKKEAVVTADFTFHPAARTADEIVASLLKQEAPATSDANRSEEKPRAAVNKHVNATLHGKEEAMTYLMERIKKRDPAGNKQLVVLFDGDPNLDNELYKALEAYGYTGRVDAMILDIIHVSEYIWDAAHALYGEKNPARVVWVKEKLLAILHGKVGRVIGGLRQIITKTPLSAGQRTVLEKAITYFDNHRHMMEYDQYLAKGYPIATGVVEATCSSLVKDRMERSGMRWSINGAQSLLKQRAVMKNGDWQEFWETHVATQRTILYADSYRLAA